MLITYDSLFSSILPKHVETSEKHDGELETSIVIDMFDAILCLVWSELDQSDTAFICSILWYLVFDSGSCNVFLWNW